MGIVLHNIFPHIQVGTFGYMFDIPLLTTAMILFGREFGGRTLFAAMLTPGLMNLISTLAYPTREALQSLDPSQLAGGIIDLRAAAPPQLSLRASPHHQGSGRDHLLYEGVD